MLSLSEKEKQNALNEIRLIASVKHPNIVQYKESFIDEGSQTLCLVMEYADDGDLQQKITEHTKRGTQFSKDQVIAIISQMVLGLKALHDSKICHRDLKCANIFLTSKGEAKLGDFNVSKVLHRGMLHTQTGTPYYASPEVWQDKPYDQKSDIWSLGCVIYEMLAKKPPFKSSSMKELYKKVIAAKYPALKQDGTYPADLFVLIKMILQPNPRLRPSCNTLLNQEIIHKHINQHGLVNGQCCFEDQLNFLSSNPSQLGQFQSSGKQDLLNTIKLTPKLSQLNTKLPRATYDDHQTEHALTQRKSLYSAGLEIMGPSTKSNHKNSIQAKLELQLDFPGSQGAMVEGSKLPILTPKPTKKGIDLVDSMQYPNPSPVLYTSGKKINRNKSVGRSGGAPDPRHARKYSALVNHQDNPILHELGQILEDTNEYLMGDTFKQGQMAQGVIAQDQKLRCNNKMQSSILSNFNSPELKDANNHPKLQEKINNKENPKSLSRYQQNRQLYSKIGETISHSGSKPAHLPGLSNRLSTNATTDHARSPEQNSRLNQEHMHSRQYSSRQPAAQGHGQGQGSQSQHDHILSLRKSFSYDSNSVDQQQQQCYYDFIKENSGDQHQLGAKLATQCSLPTLPSADPTLEQLSHCHSQRGYKGYYPAPTAAALDDILNENRRRLHALGHNSNKENNMYVPNSAINIEQYNFQNKRNLNQRANRDRQLFQDDHFSKMKLITDKRF